MSARSPRGELRQREIIRAAGELFYERGYSNVTLKEVGDAIGVTAPALYRHFTSKQDLLRAAISSGLDQVEAALDGTTDSDEPFAGVIAVAVDRADVWEIIERDAHHLGRAERHALSTRMSNIDGRIAELILRQRPGLDAALARALGKTLLFALSAPSQYALSAPRPRLTAILTDIADRIVGWEAGPDEELLVAPPSPSSTEFLGRREQVINEATRLFSSRGFDGVTMADIGDAAGVAGPSIYHYFTSKNEILFSVFRRGLERLAHDQSRFAAGASGQSAEIRGYVESYTRLALDHRELFQLFVHERHLLVNTEEPTVLRGYRDFVDRWISVLRALHPTMTGSDGRVVVACAMSVVNQLAMGHGNADDAGRIASIALSLLERPPLRRAATRSA